MDEKTETKNKSLAQGHLACVYQSQDMNPRAIVTKPLFPDIIKPASTCIYYTPLYKIV